jgi:lipopolysaccharide/colanic/teichoic acid biosynthesis glycosyltransferase
MTRVFDFLAGLVALIALAPVLLIVAAVVLLDDGRPVFFHQKRVGRNGRLFEIWKFRTMRTANQGRAITAAGDERVTGAGAWLRKLKLDELPQLFNVVKGDMSLIGPRPEVPEFVELDDAVWQAVLAVRPGITDLASLLYRDEEHLLKPANDPAEFYRAAVLPAKLRLNLQYLETRSWRRDMKLLWLTARYSFFPRGFDPHRVARTFGV